MNRGARLLIVINKFVDKLEPLIHEDRNLNMDEFHKTCLEVGRTVLYEEEKLADKGDLVHFGLVHEPKICLMGRYKK